MALLLAGLLLPGRRQGGWPGIEDGWEGGCGPQVREGWGDCAGGYLGYTMPRGKVCCTV